MQRQIKQPSTYLIIYSIFVYLWLSMFLSQAQTEEKLNPASRTDIIEKLTLRLNKLYVFPDVAKEMETALREHLDNGDYDDITSNEEFATLLTTHLRAVSNDKHLSVDYFNTPFPEEELEMATQIEMGIGMEEPSPEEIEKMNAEMKAEMQKDKFGFEKVEILEGNIGYIDLRYFGEPSLSGEEVGQYMSLVANTSALIFDLRNNGGGSPFMVAFISSYLFDRPTHLNDMYDRIEGSTQQFWTYEYVPGERFGGVKPIYVLTSQDTFSGAEEFSYNLKNLKRATIIGEVTGGGAHPGGGMPLTEHLGVWTPTGRAINPITKTNWEGVGVQPDVKTSAAEAYDTAYKLALETVLKDLGSNLVGEDATLAKEAQEALSKLEETEQ